MKIHENRTTMKYISAKILKTGVEIQEVLRLDEKSVRLAEKYRVRALVPLGARGSHGAGVVKLGGHFEPRPLGAVELLLLLDLRDPPQLTQHRRFSLRINGVLHFLRILSVRIDDFHRFLLRLRLEAPAFGLDLPEHVEHEPFKMSALCLDLVV